MNEDEKKISLSLPGEWALQKVLGPVLKEIGEDLQKLYAKGRDRIAAAAYRKIPNPEDGKQANLRVTRDAFWSGAFTDDEVCAEYFGGILAASRSEDGKDDGPIQFIDVIKSLSSKQLRLHYIIYNSLNRLLVRRGEAVNVGMGSDIEGKTIWFAGREIVDRLGLDIETSPNILFRQSLINRYQVDSQRIDAQRSLPYLMIAPTTFGVLMYSAAHNKLSEWRKFDRELFGDFPDVELPTAYASTVGEVLKLVNVNS